MVDVKEILSNVMDGKFEVVAGKKGLGKIVETVGILEYEVGKEIDENFFEGDFVITSLFFAKDSKDLADAALIRLMKNNVAALALKTIHVDSLSDKVLDYANKHDIAIIYFYDIPFEVLIMLIVDTIRQRKNYLYYEEVIKKLLSSNSNHSDVKNIAYSINNSFFNNIKTVYCKEKSTSSLGISKRIIDTFSLKRSKTTNQVSYSIFEYDEGLLIIYSYCDTYLVSDKQLNGFIQSIGIIDDIFFIGVNSSEHKLKELDHAITKSIYAYCVSKETNKTTLFSNIGIYKLLLPLQNNYYAKDFSNSIIDLIIEYDQVIDGPLLLTAKSFVKNNASFVETSKELHQHVNTIRYRINKIKEIASIIDDDFYEQLYFAIKLFQSHKLNI
ncbi:MAG: PucR family transcriptional regulator ligand-binding domain-containing protein [Acidaminobacteraceae bacterium]